MSKEHYGSGEENALEIAGWLYKVVTKNIRESAALNPEREEEMHRDMAIIWYGALLGMAGTAAMIAQGENNADSIRLCVDEMALVAANHFPVLSGTGKSFIIDRKHLN